MEFHTYYGISILIKGDVMLLCTFQFGTPVKTYFPSLFSNILCMQPNSSGSGVPYLKQLFGVVGISIIFY